MRSRLYNCKTAHEIRVDAHHGGEVVELTAVVGGGKDRHELAVTEEVVAVLDDLVRAAHEVELVPVEEVLENVVAEYVAHAPVVSAPPPDGGWVAPHEVADHAVVGDFEWAAHVADLFILVQIGRKAAMATENLLVDHGGEGQAAEHFGEVLPYLEARRLVTDAPETSLALIVEAVHAVDAGALVVATKQKDFIRVFDFEREEHDDGLKAVSTAVNVVAEEEVARVRRVALHLENAEQIVELSMDVTDNSDGCLHLEKGVL